jgi:hypothetical protein
VLDSSWRVAGPDEDVKQRSFVYGYTHSGLARLKLSPGKHTLRLAVMARRWFAGSAGPVRVLSAPVDIEVAPTPSGGGRQATKGPEDDSPWGEPVNGFWVRLRKPAAATPDDGPPHLLVDIASDEWTRYMVTTNSSSWQLEVDGKWYVSKEADFKVTEGQKGLPIIMGIASASFFVVPGQPWTNLPLLLDGSWRVAGPEEVTAQRFSSLVRTYPDNPVMVLPPGKHTLRVAVVTGPQVCAVSGPVEIEAGSVPAAQRDNPAQSDP